MLRKTMAAFTFTALIAGQASAADAEGNFYIMGDPGVMTCETLNTKMNDEQAGVMLGTWIAGYVTALNRTTADTYNMIGGVQPADIFNAIIAHCAQAPADLVETAVFNAINGVYERRLTAKPAE